MKRGKKKIVDQEMSFLAHLTALRSCLWKGLLAWLMGTVISFYFTDQIFGALTKPLGEIRLVMLAPAEGFFTYLKIAIYGGFVLSSPVLFYQLLVFIQPAMRHRERIGLYILLPGALILLTSGIAFGYFIALPLVLQYLINFSGYWILPMLSVQRYIGFVSRTLIMLGIVFELPLFILFLNRWGVITPGLLRRKRQYALLLSFIIGAILTPPDLISQLLMAGPLICLYEVSIWLTYLFNFYKARKEEKLLEELS